MVPKWFQSGSTTREHTITVNNTTAQSIPELEILLWWFTRLLNLVGSVIYNDSLNFAMELAKM